MIDLKLEYRKASEKDTKLLLMLDQEAFNRSFDTPFKNEKELKNFLAKSEVYLILLDNNPVGYYSYNIEKEEAEILAVVVTPKWQGKGIGSEVLSKIINEIKDKVVKTKIATHPENIPAIHLYWKFDFKITDWIERYYDNKPRLVMESKR